MIYTLGYLALTVLTARWIAPHLLDEVGGPDPDFGDLIISRALGLIIGCLWPVVVLGAVVMWKTPKSRGQLKRERDEAQARIRELERELGIGK